MNLAALRRSPASRLAPCASRPLAAFTLIELLVVIAIIAVLAGLVSATAMGVLKKGKIKRTQTELNQLKTVIELYKSKKGFYPPSNPADALANYLQVNPLYYELVGTKYSPPNYIPLDGQKPVTPGMLASMGVSAIANSSSGASSDDAAGAESLVKSFGPKQARTNSAGIMLLISPVYGPDRSDFNPWYYNSHNPTNNPDTFDLWTVILVGGKTNVICNWSEKPIIIK